MHKKTIRQTPLYIFSHTWEDFQLQTCQRCFGPLSLAAISLLNVSPTPSDMELFFYLPEDCGCGTHQRTVQAIKYALFIKEKGKDQ